MRALIASLLFLLAAVAQAQTKPPCSVAWARELLATAQAKDPVTAKAKDGDSELDRAVRRILECNDKQLLTMSLNDASVGVASAGGSGGTGATGGLGRGKPAPGASGTGSGPSPGGGGDASGARGTSVPGKAVKPGGPRYDEATWRAVLNAIESDLVTRIDKCQGFTTKNCTLAEFRAWTKDLADYLDLLQTNGVPESSLRQASDLFRAAAAASPAFPLAQAILAAFEQLSAADQAHLKRRIPEFGKLVEAGQGGQRLKYLLEHPDSLKPMFQELLAVGVGRVAVTGRSVIVHHDLSGLSAQNTCKALSADALSLALSNARPPGVLLFPVGSMTASPHVCLAARVLTQGVESGECHAAAGQHCVRVDVRGWFTDKGGAPPDCAQKDGVPEPDLVTSVTSRPFSACPDAAVLGDVASEVFAAFALRVGTRDAGVEEAALIQPGCVEMLRVVPKSWAAPLKASATERPPVHLDGAHWAGFSQELAEALTLAGMLGEVTWGTKEPERGLIFSWSEPEASAAGDARKVELTLRWKGAGAPAEAVTLKFSPTERKECRLTSLGYQRTVAARTAMWLLGARFPDMAPAPDPESTSKASDKNWAAAPLGLLLPGLPQVIDGHAERGAVLAAIDTVFLTASLVLVLTSVGERRAVSRGEPDASVHSANQQLAAGLCLGGVAVGTRVVSVLW